jgi:hypothetical protein
MVCLERRVGDLMTRIDHTQGADRPRRFSNALSVIL